MHWLDALYGMLLRRTPSFRRGWGDEAWLRGPPPDLLEVSEPSPLSIEWGRSRVNRDEHVREGSFVSCEPALPGPCQRVHLRWISPAQGPVRATCLLLASWGDENGSMRLRIARPLVREGISVLVMENAFYGVRRTEPASAAPLATVSDFVRMGTATVREARALARWMRDEGLPAPMLAGYSMGGQMAALTAASVPWPVRVVAMAPSASPAPVFTEGPLHRAIDWDALGGAAAKPRLAELLRSFSVLRLPPPDSRGRAIVVGTRRDGFVPPSDMQAIATHWPHAELRWLDAGHVGAVVFHVAALRQALREVAEEAR
ncbi:MAG: alpha/beta hydrolase family protein [Myxococcaceae bacterium]